MQKVYSTVKFSWWRENLNLRSWYSLAEVTIVIIERTENRTARVSELMAEAEDTNDPPFIGSSHARFGPHLNADDTVTEDQRKNNSC